MTDDSPGVPTVPGLTGLTVLARGGYATVYRAVQESVGREVAVKVENRELADEEDQRRFLREARAAGRMSGHPNVIDLFDAGVTGNGHPYLIMELCASTYADRMRTDPLAAVEARDLGVKIADALADAHALGVLHRDVKPANLLLSRFGEPQLADFGLAVLVEARPTAVMLDVCTPAYAPPEMFRYAPPSPAADVYALGASLYALMSGRPARWRDEPCPTLGSLLDMFDEPIPDLPGVPADVMDLLRAGMANEPDDRPTAEELRDALYALDIDPGDRPARRSRRPVFVPPTPVDGDRGATRRYPFQVDPLRFTLGALGTPDTPADDDTPTEPADDGAAPAPLVADEPAPTGRRLRFRPAARPWLWLG